MNTSIQCIPWNEGFLNALLQQLLEDTGSTHPKDLSQCLVLFPHNRPQRYATAFLRHDTRFGRPLVLPEWQTVSSLFSCLSRSIGTHPCMTASLLDRVGMLIQSIRATPDLASLLSFHPSADAAFETFPSGDTFPSGIFGAGTAEHSINTAAKLPFEAQYFFPWGVRLVALFEECLTHNKTPENFLYSEEHVSPFAGKLLSHLGSLFALYLQRMKENGWTTPGNDAFSVAQHLSGQGTLPDHFFTGKRIYLAGFFALTGTEEALLRHVWDHYPTRVLVHADPALATGEAAHWSCAPLAKWAKRWKTTITHYGTVHESAAASSLSPTLHFTEGFDLHSQLGCIQQQVAMLPVSEADPANETAANLNDTHDEYSRELSPEDDSHQSDHIATPFAAETLILLPDSGLLMPMLHHLPAKDLNISMGYPLVRSPLFRLIDTIFQLQERKKNSRYYWKDLVELVRHPYLKMLTTEDPSGNDSSLSQNLRQELHRFEQTSREYDSAFLLPEDVLEAMYSTMDAAKRPSPALFALLQQTLACTLTEFSALITTADMANALNRLCTHLMTYGAPLWKRFPIDAECMFRLRQSLIPELAASALANEPLSAATLFSITRQLIQAERVPFNATPLVGTQIMGMLETRLLTFRRIIVVDATEGNIPGIPQGDPLLPETLRAELELPDMAARETVGGYHFFRLIAGAEHVHLLWQENAESDGLQSGKNKKSRFIEELLWKEEKQQGYLFSDKKAKASEKNPYPSSSAQNKTSEPLTVLSSMANPFEKEYISIPVTPPLRQKINDLLEKKVSASLLDAYLRCPVRFCYERILRFTEPTEVAEDSDPRAIGNLLHHTLQEFYEPRLGIDLPDGPQLAEKAGKELLAIFQSRPEYTAFKQTVPADSFAMLDHAGKIRLNRYLHNQPPCRVLALEQPLTAKLCLSGRSILLSGYADRIDRREDSLIILDYKTGALPLYKSTLWMQDTLWHRMKTWTPSISGKVNSDPFFDLQSYLQSVQLPLYLYLLHHSANTISDNISDNYTNDMLNAAWVALATDGTELPLFADATDASQREKIITEHIPALFQFVIQHLATTDHFFPSPGKHCDWCPCQGLCLRQKGCSHLESLMPLLS